MQSKLTRRKKIITFILLILSVFSLQTFFIGNALHAKSYAVTLSIPPEFTIPPSYQVNPSWAGPTIHAILSGTVQQGGFFGNFPGQFPDIYNFIKKLFDGTEFYIAPSQNTCPNSTPLQGLTIQLQGPKSVPKPQNLDYTILVSYSGTQDVTITETIPQNTKIVGHPTGTLYYTNNNSVINWDLKQNIPTSLNLYKFQFTLFPTKNNIHVLNAICWTSQAAPSPSGSPPSITPPNGNYCDQTYLRNFWPDDPNAKYASCVCKLASGGKVNFEQIDCTQPYDSNKGNFHSDVGLFAVAIADVIGQKIDTNCDASFQNQNSQLNGGTPTCKITDQAKFNVCKADMETPATNINFAFKQWQNWNLTPPVQNWGYYTTLYSNLTSVCGNPPQP